MWPLLMGTSAFGQVTAPGSSEQIWLSSSSLSAANVSMRGVDGDYWFAVEYVDPNNATEPGLHLVWYDTSAPAMASKSLQSTGALTNNAIYPSIFTRPNGTNVVVAGKVDGLFMGNEPHLKLHTQVRTSFQTAHTSENVTAAGSLEHALPHLTRDPELPAFHLCWTSKNSTVEDVATKVKDGTTWVASTARTVADSTDIEDHCSIDFTYSGRRYTVYHRDQAGATDPDIWLEITTWDGTTWTTVAEFGLDDSEGLDFPSIWVRNTSTTTEVAVVAVANGNVSLWHCGAATESSCDSATEFGAPLVDQQSGEGWTFPQVIIVPRGSTIDTYAFVEDTTGTVRLRVISNCGGSQSAFTDEGQVPMPEPYEDRSLSGYVQSWARSQLSWDGSNIHMAFMAEKYDADTFDVLLYTVDPDDLCP